MNKLIENRRDFLKSPSAVSYFSAFARFIPFSNVCRVSKDCAETLKTIAANITKMLKIIRFII